MSAVQIQVEEGLARGGMLKRDPILFVPEVADQLRRSVDAVRWLISTKQLKSGKLGGRVVVRQSDLDSFVEAGFSD